MTLVLRNVRPWGGAPADILINDGLIAAVGQAHDATGEEIDGRGGTLLPGLHDHHIHLLALAASRQSVDLAGLTSVDEIAFRLRTSPGRQWIRAIGYDERAAGIPDAALLDRWVDHRPMRLADRTGALRVLNSLAMAELRGVRLPPGAERDGNGRPNGRFWREDHWLARALPGTLPDLAGEGRMLASLGLTTVTDATAHNGPEEAHILAGALPQRLILMGSEALLPGHGYGLGPLKLAIDERNLPSLDDLELRIREARQRGRRVAAHCVTEAELVTYLAALDAAGGASHGDRIEHGGIIPASLVEVIAQAGLMVVTNPAFIHDRGDRYVDAIEPDRWEELYPAAGLARAGIVLRGGSDAPYANPDPWLAMRAASTRRSAGGHLIGGGQRLDALGALHLYCRGEIKRGMPADLILCEGDLAGLLSDLSADRLRLTIIAGEAVFHRRA